MLREVLQELSFDSYVKVSGSKGLQVYVPLNSAVTYEQTKPLAQGIAQLLAQREPKLIVWQMPKRLRTKKVFIDWSQNDDYKTTVSVYSLRSKITARFRWIRLFARRLLRGQGPDLHRQDQKRFYAGAPPRSREELRASANLRMSVCQSS